MEDYLINLVNKGILCMNSENSFTMEGTITQIPQQKEDLLSLVQQYHPRRVLEIGFNCGHSSEVFLGADPDLTVTSFDIGTHQYTAYGKQFIDNQSRTPYSYLGRQHKNYSNFLQEYCYRVTSL